MSLTPSQVKAIAEDAAHIAAEQTAQNTARATAKAASRGAVKAALAQVGLSPDNAHMNGFNSGALSEKVASLEKSQDQIRQDIDNLRKDIADLRTELHSKFNIQVILTIAAVAAAFLAQFIFGG